VVVPAGAFEDVAGNDFAGIAAGGWNFTVKPAPTPTDNTPPAVAGLSPANGATNVAISTNSLEITFDENINKGTGNITVSGTGFTQTIDVTTNAVKVNGKKATIDLSQTLPFATAISVAVPQGAFEDETGKDFAGLAASAWTFTTIDAPTPPTTRSRCFGLSPADEATAVARERKAGDHLQRRGKSRNRQHYHPCQRHPQTVTKRQNAVKFNKRKVTIDAAPNFQRGQSIR
jgi:hypothetical protein